MKILTRKKEVSAVIYILEDDVNIRQMEAYALEHSGYQALELENAAELWQALSKQIPEMLTGDEDGMAVLKKMRTDSRLSNIPIIIISAKASELDLVKGLDGGADDYLTKPFGIMEFISRVKAILRRIDHEPSKQLVFGEIVLDDEKKQVFAQGEVCHLTFKEHELLKLFLQNPDVVFSREKIMDKIWGYDYLGESRTVDMHIKSLRQKLGACGDYIKTVRGVGYKVELP